MHHLTQPQVKALLQAVEDDRDRCGLLVAYLHGLRVSEMMALRVKDVAGGYITVPRRKGSKKTTHLLIAPSDLVLDEKTALEELISKYQLGPEDQLFPASRKTYDRRIKTAGAKAGIPEHLRHMHVLKHSVAMHMVKKIDLKELQQYLGHKSLNSTAQYLHVTDAEASQAVVNVFEETTK
jgi:integrase